MSRIILPPFSSCTFCGVLLFFLRFLLFVFLVRMFCVLIFDLLGGVAGAPLIKISNDGNFRFLDSCVLHVGVECSEGKTSLVRPSI
ncbi:hypothetical protein F5X96DRAFT_629542 [Biscogniauxia mediterranea]|nr:hypothetical protein F5X96DRAFT_629542 [Biscogniauxia mediterranea]